MHTDLMCATYMRCWKLPVWWSMEVEYEENADFLLAFLANFADQLPHNQELKDSYIDTHSLISTMM